MTDEPTHKLVIDCPVAQNPEIFSRINGSIETLKKTLEAVEKKADNAEDIAVRGKKKVDFLYWFFGTLLGLATFSALIYNMLTG
jgi:hypothetical protein